jgi:hypothetical protein
LPQLPHDIEAALIREHHVKQNQIKRVVFGKPQRTSAIFGKLNLEELLLQSAYERRGHLGLVFYDKNVHENRTVYGARLRARNARMNATLQSTAGLKFERSGT